MIGDEPLIGRHVALEPLGEHHVGALVAAASGDRSSFEFTFVPDGHPSVVAYVARAVADREAGVSAPFVVRRLCDDEVVGSTRYLDIDDFDAQRTAAVHRGESVGPPGPPRALEIGATWYCATAQRTAVNTECKLLLLAHAFDVLGVLRVTFKTDARNARSREAIERLGAGSEGLRRCHMLAADGHVRDTAYYSIVASEWPDVRTRLESRLARSGSS